MIVKNLTIFTKKQYKLYKFIKFFQICLSLLLLVIILSIVFFSSVSSEKNYLQIGASILLALLGILGVFESIWKSFKNDHIFIYKFLIRHLKSSLFPPTNEQKQLFKEIHHHFNINTNNVAVGITSRHFSGKSTAVMLYLEQYIKIHKSNNSLIKNVIYIDCSIEKIKLLEYFQTTYNLKNCYVIIDNLENVNQDMIEKFLHRGENLKFILISSQEIHSNHVKSLKKEYLFKNIPTDDINGFNKKLDRLHDDTKRVLLFVYYITLSKTLVYIPELVGITKINQKEIMIILKHLHKEQFIKFFPFNHSYIFLINKKTLLHQQKSFWNNPINTEVINYFLCNTNNYAESTWIALLHLPYNNIKDIPLSKRHEIFSKAISQGNYQKLDLLLNYAISLENTGELFIYEKGVLDFYNRRQNEALRYFDEIIIKTADEDLKIKSILKVIETCHGDNSKSIQKKLNDYIKYLKLQRYPYCLYAEYWQMHIESEKGIFLPENHLQLLNQFLNIKSNYKNDELFNSVLKRSITDYLRISQLSFRKIPKQQIEKIKIEWGSILGETEYNYYLNLYMYASEEHYFNLQTNVLQRTSIENVLDKGEEYYRLSFESEFQNQRSIESAKLKQLDFQLSNQSFNLFKEGKSLINSFIEHSKIHNISVFVAYGYTLLAKLLLVEQFQSRPLETPHNIEIFSNIENYLTNSIELYSKFNNDYGVFRSKLLLIFMKIVKNNYFYQDNFTIFLEEVSNLKTHNFNREHQIIKFLNDHKNDTGNAIRIQTIIRTYPIILQ